MSSVCGAVRPSVVFLQIEDAVCHGHRRRAYNSLWGTVERSRTGSGAPTRWAYTRCAEAHQANGGPRAVAVTGPGQAATSCTHLFTETIQSVWATLYSVSVLAHCFSPSGQYSPLTVHWHSVISSFYHQISRLEIALRMLSPIKY